MVAVTNPMHNTIQHYKVINYLNKIVEKFCKFVQQNKHINNLAGFASNLDLVNVSDLKCALH